MPVLYFSINMVTEAVTADEPQYEECITDIRNLKSHAASGKVLYEYKLAQLTLGTAFWFLPDAAKTALGAQHIWKIYKCLHWLFMFIFSLITADVWRKDILLLKDERKNHVAENIVLMVLTGLPLACLLMKVTNYDAGSTYPAVLGISMIWAAFHREDRRLAFLATVVTALGVLDKWTALPYWAVSVVFFAFLAMRMEKGWKRKSAAAFISTALAYSAALGISIAYFIYAYFQQGGFCREIDLGVIIFSYVHAVKAMATGDLTVNSSNQDLFYIPILFACIIACTFMIYGICEVLEKRKIHPAQLFLKLDGIFITACILCGWVAAFLIPLRIAPFLEIKNGAYVSTDSFDGWQYHFGAKTAIGHFTAKVGYQWATIITNYPTVILLLTAAAGVILLIRKHEDDLLICSLILSGALALLVLYAIAGLPSDARYYSYPMLVVVLCGIDLMYRQNLVMPYKKMVFLCAYALYLIEMCIYIPNVKAFTPVWLWHSDEHNKEVRTGQWYAGEAMFWGEQVAIAGNIIEEIAGTAECSKIVIYSDYSSSWPGNPGYIVMSLNHENAHRLRFDHHAYYVINRFKIFRDEIPNYIYEVEPIYAITYKGETGAWIYRGDQLKEYENEIAGE